MSAVTGLLIAFANHCRGKESLLTAHRSLERYAQGDESEEVLQQLLDDVRGIARYGGGV